MQSPDHAGDRYVCACMPGMMLQRLHPSPHCGRLLRSPLPRQSRSTWAFALAWSGRNKLRSEMQRTGRAETKDRRDRPGTSKGETTGSPRGTSNSERAAVAGRSRSSSGGQPPKTAVAPPVHLRVTDQSGRLQGREAMLAHRLVRGRASTAGAASGAANQTGHRMAAGQPRPVCMHACRALFRAVR